MQRHETWVFHEKPIEWPHMEIDLYDDQVLQSVYLMLCLESCSSLLCFPVSMFVQGSGLKFPLNNSTSVFVNYCP